MPYHAGLHHPGSLLWPCDRLLVPVVAVLSWRRILDSPRLARQGAGPITTMPQPILNRCGPDRARARAYARTYGDHRTDHAAASRLLGVLGPRRAPGARDLRGLWLSPREAGRRQLVALRRTRKSGCARLHRGLRRAPALRARRDRRPRLIPRLRRP